MQSNPRAKGGGNIDELLYKRMTVPEMMNPQTNRNKKKNFKKTKGQKPTYKT